MSFLIADGHVEITSRNEAAKRDIRELVQELGAINPAAQAASNGLKDLRTRATAGGQALAGLERQADKATRTLTELRAAAGDINIRAHLDDQTTAGAAAAKAALRDLKAESPVLLAARLDDETAAGITAVRQAIRDLREESPVRLRIDFDGDSTQITASATAVRDLRGDAQGAGTALTALASRSTAAATGLDSLGDQARQASRSLARLRSDASAAAAALTDLRASSTSAHTSLRTLSNRADSAGGRLGDLSTRTRTLRDDMSDLDGTIGPLLARLLALRGAFGSTGSGAGVAHGGLSRLTAAALLLAPALIPVAAAGVPLAAGFTAAAAGVLAFGAAIIPQIARLAEAAEAEKKYTDAVREHGRGSKEAAEASAAQQRVLRQLPPATQEAAAAFSNLKREYKGWSDSLSPETMQVATRTMALLSALFPKTTGLVRGTSTEVSHLLAVLGGAVQTPGFDRAMQRFTEYSQSTLRRATAETVQFVQALQTGEVGGNVKEFMTFARQHGPLVAETFGNLGRAALHLLASLADTGVSILTVANALAQLVTAVPSAALSTFIQLYAAFKLASLGANMLTAATGSTAVARLTAFVAAARLNGVSSALSGVVGGMSTMGKAVGIAAAAFAAFYVGQKIGEAFWSQTPTSAEHVANAIARMGNAGRMAAPDLRTLSDSADRLKNTSIADTIYDYGTFHANQEWKKASGDFEAWDQQLSELVSSGNMTAAKNSFDQISASLRKQGLSGREISELFPQYKQALAGAKQEAKLAADGMGLFGRQAIETKSKLDAQKSSADGLRQSLQALNDVNRAGLGGMIGFEQAIDDAAKAAKKNAGALSMTHGELNLNGKKAREAATALSDLAAKTDDATSKARESGASWQQINGIYSRGRSAFVQAAQAMGLTAKEANQLANQLLKIPDKKSTKVSMQTEDAVAGLNSVIGAIKKTPDSKSVTVKALSAGAITTLQDLGFKVKRLPDGSFKVTAKTGDVGSKLDAVRKQRDGIKDKSITLSAKAQAALGGLDRVMAAIRKTPGSKSVTVKTLSGSAIAALESVGFKVKRLPDGSLSVTAKTASAKANIAAVQRARDGLSSKTITITTHYRITGSKNIPSGTYYGSTAGRSATGGAIPRRAAGGDVEMQMYPQGGLISGPGSATSDSILTQFTNGAMAWTSDTEYVMRAAAVRKYGVGMMDALNAGRLPRFAKGGLTEKQKAAQEKIKAARSELTSDVTFTAAGRLAGYKNAEVSRDLGTPESVSSLVTTINNYLKNIKDAFSGKTEASLLSQLTKSGATLLAYQKQLEGVNKKLEDAKSALTEVQGEFDNLRSSIKGSLVSFGNLTKTGKWGTSTETLISQLQSDTSRTTEFSKQLADLKKMGLDPQILSDIAAAGVTGGGMATATSLLGASPEQIAKINALQKQLTTAADAAGKTTADAMYGAGLRAAEGLVAGLQSQQDKIEAAMMKIAKSMEAAIRKALGIKSPSTVMEQVGNYAFQGVEQGWAKRMAAGNTLISGSKDVATSPKPIAAATAPAIAASPTVARPGGPTVNLTVNVSTDDLTSNPAERRQFAKNMARDINDALRTYQRERA